MIPTLEELGLNRFSLEQQIAIADALWDSVEDELALAPVPENQLAELDRRIEKSLAHPEAAPPWEEVKARILARAKQ